MILITLSTASLLLILANFGNGRRHTEEQEEEEQWVPVERRGDPPDGQDGGQEAKGMGRGLRKFREILAKFSQLENVTIFHFSTIFSGPRDGVCVQRGDFIWISSYYDRWSFTSWSLIPNLCYDHWSPLIDYDPRIPDQSLIIHIISRDGIDFRFSFWYPSKNMVLSFFWPLGIFRQRSLIPSCPWSLVPDVWSMSSGIPLIIDL